MLNRLVLATAALLFAGSGAMAEDACPGATLDVQIPHEVARTTTAPNYASNTQSEFDCFSWKSLIALNWPAKAGVRGEPDLSLPFGKLGGDGQLVWQSYWNRHDVVQPKAVSPCPACPAGSDADCLKACWNTPQALPAVCSGLEIPDGTRIAGILDGFQQAAPNSWLTDQNGNLTRYEVRMNEDEFDYIVGNQFYNRTVQAAQPEPFNFPTGANTGALGAIELKGAWRIMTPNDDRSRYLAQDVVIVDSKLDPLTGFEDPTNGSFLTCNAPGEGPCCVRPMGLVGLHIAHKVKDNPQWVWSTFEHVDNAPVEGTAPDPNVKYSYFSPSCPAGERRCTPNLNPRDAHSAMTVPVQVERVIQNFEVPHPSAGQPEPLLPQPVNDQWHHLVKGTIWENYVLVSTQWPAKPGAANPSIDNDGTPDPQFLANTTLETYSQANADSELVSSCIGCHVLAVGRNNKTSDFSFLLLHAESP